MERPPNAAGQSPKDKLISLIKGFLSYENYATFLPPFSLGTWFFFLGGFFTSLIIGWIVFPLLLYSSQPQPVQFSHAIHMDEERVFGIEGETETERCLYCHTIRDDGSFRGIPKLESCMECHDDPEMPLGETEEEQEFLNKYVAEEIEIPWLIYSKQPDCVYFSHTSHVLMAELDCRNCHGDHGRSDKLPIYKENRLTGYSIDIWGRNIAGYSENFKLASADMDEGDEDYVRVIKTDDGEEKYVIRMTSMKMDDCADCHTIYQQEQNNACFVCHK